MNYLLFLEEKDSAARYFPMYVKAQPECARQNCAFGLPLAPPVSDPNLPERAPLRGK
jgi:hypothetical protein